MVNDLHIEVVQHNTSELLQDISSNGAMHVTQQPTSSMKSQCWRETLLIEEHLLVVPCWTPLYPGMTGDLGVPATELQSPRVVTTGSYIDSIRSRVK